MLSTVTTSSSKKPLPGVVAVALEVHRRRLPAEEVGELHPDEQRRRGRRPGPAPWPPRRSRGAAPGAPTASRVSARQPRSPSAPRARRPAPGRTAGPPATSPGHDQDEGQVPQGLGDVRQAVRGPGSRRRVLHVAGEDAVRRGQSRAVKSSSTGTATTTPAARAAPGAGTAQTRPRAEPADPPPPPGRPAARPAPVPTRRGARPRAGAGRRAASSSTCSVTRG